MVLYKCNTCNKLFKQKNDYRRHKNRKIPCKKITNISPKDSPKKDRQFKCNLCGKTYKLKQHLTRHILQSCKVIKVKKNNGENLETFEEDTNILFYESANDSTDDDFDRSNFNLHQKTPKKNFNTKITPKKSNHVCKYCSKQFSRKDSLTRHLIDRCKVRKENEEDMKKILNKLIWQMKEQGKQMKNLKTENKKLRVDMTNIKGNTTTNNNNTQNTQNIQQNFNLLSFGKDNTESITNEEVLQILKRGFNAIKLAVKKTNFDPDRPENHNVYINNIKSLYAVTYNKGNWELDKTEDVIDRIYDDKYVFLEEKYQELKDEMTPYHRKRMKRIFDEYEKVKEERTFGEIKLVLYNNRHIPIKTRKKMERQVPL
uniref:C2H2-type domain-containing protein n=1 Tax=Mimivirus LCMiAC02 TaxID=2506609 RepID=A0A481Z2D9_9VIRU|nr:MAG: uncharacterized protein LCMiAC02_05540 [Mimivirus LCMiAC02]